MSQLELIPADEVYSNEERMLEITKKAGRMSTHHGYDTVNSGGFMKRCIMKVLGIDISHEQCVQMTGGRDIQRPIDFIWNNGYEKLKIKHIYSCLHFRQLGIKGKPLEYWNYRINYNDKVDAFILTAFSNLECLEPIHFWVILAKEILDTQRSKKEFWDRPTFACYNTKNGILKMNRYEDIDKLNKLRDLIKNEVL